MQTHSTVSINEKGSAGPNNSPIEFVTPRINSLIQCVCHFTELSLRCGSIEQVGALCVRDARHLQGQTLIRRVNPPLSLPNQSVSEGKGGGRGTDRCLQYPGPDRAGDTTAFGRVIKSGKFFYALLKPRGQIDRVLWSPGIWTDAPFYPLACL